MTIKLRVQRGVLLIGGFMFKEYDNCTLCPRKCGVNRNLGETGVCTQTSEIKIGRSDLHYWEEPCVSGENGSGTVFFSGCSLRCIYCQNYNLGRGGAGQKLSGRELCDVFTELQRKGAHNINLVTADHFAPHIKDAVVKARKNGLTIPVALNTGGYISEETLEILKDVIDIYLVDFKYMDSEIARKYSSAPDYPEIVRKAIAKMLDFVGESVFDKDGILQKGVVVRHLCLPSHTEDSKSIIKYLFDTCGARIIYSIMRQYTPVRKSEKYPNLNRRITEKEYDEIIDFCIETGLEDAYIQDDECALESFIPEFQ